MENIEFMRAVAQDIIQLKFEDEDTIQDCWEKFYDIMRKHGIKMGTKHENGVSMANFEWTMCKILFQKRMEDDVNFKKIFEYPKDLAHY